MSKMLESLTKALQLAAANAPFYVMPQYKNKAIVYEIMPPHYHDKAHSQLVTFDEAEDLCEQLNSEYVVKEVLKEFENIYCSNEYYSMRDIVNKIVMGKE